LTVATGTTGAKMETVQLVLLEQKETLDPKGDTGSNGDTGINGIDLDHNGTTGAKGASPAN
jgi:hypothetical protein